MTRAKTLRLEKLVLDPSPVARGLLWHAYSLDTACLDEPEYHEPFEKPGAHLFWVVSGRGTLDTHAHQHPLSPGHAVWFIDMMTPRIYSPQSGQRLVKRGIRFGGLGVERWHEQLGGNRQAQFVLRNPVAVHSAYREIWQIVKHQAPGWEWKVHLALVRVLGVLLASRGLLAQDRVEVPPPVVRVLDAIAARPFYDWRVEQLSSIAGVSYSSLRTLFQISQKENLHAYLQRCRLLQAKQLLFDQRLSVKEIAEQLHFSSEFYFSHFFKRWTGMSPSEFRKRLK